MSIEPESGLVIPVSKLIRVLFPEPLLPSIPKNSCLPIEKLTFDKSKLEYFFDTSLNSMMDDSLDVFFEYYAVDFLHFYTLRTIIITASMAR